MQFIYFSCEISIRSSYTKLSNTFGKTDPKKKKIIRFYYKKLQNILEGLSKFFILILELLTVL